MKSNIKQLSTKKGWAKPSDLMFAARIAWPTARQVWDGDLSKTRGETLVKLARALDCSIEDLFDIEETNDR